MPNSSTKVLSSGLYVPDRTGSSNSQEEEGPLHAYVERTLEGIESYARREPWAFAIGVFGVGFILGWKLKPW